MSDDDSKRDPRCERKGRCLPDCSCESWEAPCRTCGVVIRMHPTRWDAGCMDDCDSCCGYPFCMCRVSHKGNCTKETIEAMI